MKTIFVVLFFLIFSKVNCQDIPIYIPEYQISILKISKLNDTINYKRSNVEYYKLVFFDFKGKAYFERYKFGKLLEKGWFTNSLDTLKKYITLRSAIDSRSSIKVQKYYQPLKDGTWIIYERGSAKSETYNAGIISNND